MSFGSVLVPSDSSSSILTQPLRCRHSGESGSCRENTPVLVHLARVQVHRHSKPLIVVYPRGLIQFPRLVVQVRLWKDTRCRPMIPLLIPGGFLTRNLQVNGIH